MNFPVYLRLGSLILHPHAIFEGLGYCAGFLAYLRERRRLGDVVSTESRTWIIVAAVLGGIVGSRLLYLAENPLELGSRRGDAAFLLGGKSIVGGLIGGLIAVEWVKKRLGVTVPTGDVLVLPLVLGIAIGRVGCFLSGLSDQTYGVATILPWGIDFGDGVRRHPTQLYEIAFLGALALLMVVHGDRLTATGDRFRFFMLAYLTFRLLVDLIKPGVFIGGLSVIQWACVATIAYYAPHVRRLTLELRHG
jgi:phosphatidylglycerol---prolipoprotein diacylglyceryl transferase